jgi:hypothetical protein
LSAWRERGLGVGPNSSSTPVLISRSKSPLESPEDESRSNQQ